MSTKKTKRDVFEEIKRNKKKVLSQIAKFLPTLFHSFFSFFRIEWKQRIYCIYKFYKHTYTLKKRLWTREKQILILFVEKVLNKIYILSIYIQIIIMIIFIFTLIYTFYFLFASLSVFSFHSSDYLLWNKN